MTRYHLLRKFIFVLLVIYFVVGLSREFMLQTGGREKELIPFFSWFLFEKVPGNTRSQLAIRIVEYQGKKLDPPVLFEQADGIVDEPRSSKAKELIRRFGPEVMSGRAQEAERLRRILEQVYLPDNVRYELVMLQYNPVQRFEQGSYEVTTIKNFEKVSDD
jgi:hypothetical protein